MHALKSLVCTAALLGTAAMASADIAFVQNGVDGYAGMKDVWIAGGYAHNSVYGENPANGRYGNLLGTAGGVERRIVQHWDLSSLTDKVESVNSVRLYIAATGGPDNSTSVTVDRGISIYEIPSTNASWTDVQTGTVHTGWDRTKLNWDARQAGDGDSHWYDAHGTAYANTTKGVVAADSKLIGQNTAISGKISGWANIFFDLDVDTVTSWIKDPANNAGLVFKADGADQNLGMFVLGSQMYANTDGTMGTPPVVDDGYGNNICFFPKLVIDYNAVPEPASLALLGLGGVALLARRKK